MMAWRLCVYLNLFVCCVALSVGLGDVCAAADCADPTNCEADEEATCEAGEDACTTPDKTSGAMASVVAAATLAAVALVVVA